MSNPYGSTSAWGSPPSHRGIGLCNTVHSEVAPCLPLPSLPVCFGASDPELRLADETATGFIRGNSWSLNRPEVVAQANRIAGMLSGTDVSYLNLKGDINTVPYGYVEPLQLYDEVLRCSPRAFEHVATVNATGQISCSTLSERKSSESSAPVDNQKRKEYIGNFSHLPDSVTANGISGSSSKKPKVKKKGNDDVMSSVRPDPVEVQEVTIGNFCEVLEDICGRAEITSDDREEAEWLSLSASDLRILVNEISSMRAKKLLQLVPVSTLARLLRVLDQQIHRAEGLSVEDCVRSDSDAVSLVSCALESIHCALAVMAFSEMPKELYKEEIIERILEFTKYQIIDIMSAYDPLYRALHKPSDNGALGVDEDEDADEDFSSSSKKRRTNKNVKVKKSTFNKVSAAAHSVLQKLCTILGFIKDLLLIERLADSCILQLLKTSFTTFLVDNIQILQLKAMSLISGIFYSYRQHRNYVIDEIIQLFWKLPSSKRAIRAYHLPDEEQRQIQMVSALLIQLIHAGADLPGALRQGSTSNSVLEVSVDASCVTKCYESVTEACCLFWTHVLQRLTAAKAQDTSELKAMLENLVVDLLTTLNLPEYPASAPLLMVLCVLLLQNAGLKSKDVAARSMAIDILGTIGAKLKSEAVRFQRDRSWILQELVDDASVDSSNRRDECTICLDGSETTLFICQGCQRLFHADCVGLREDEVPAHSWLCPFCLCKKQLLVLQSFCRSQCKIDGERNRNQSGKLSEASIPITKAEIIQQMLLNYLQDVGSTDDLHLFVRWFYLCLWYKDDPMSQQKYAYYLARLRSKAIVRDTGIVSSWLTRDTIKKITLALGQNNSFSRGFDKILDMLLASLKENSPVIRAKALRAVSIIVEADPEVLRDKRVQLAVEGRFCDSAISVREAALELVGRHIASHPDVGMQYYEKVAERIKDTGVSVRKRAIKIIRDMCTSNANFSEYTSACIEIISRVSDDESSVQDLVCKTFYEFWFEESSVSHTQYFGDGSSVPLDVAKKTEQIVDMLRRLSNQQPLVTVIKRNLALDFFPSSAKAAGINPVSFASVRKRCELMCKCLLEKILQVGEMNGEEVEVCTLPYVLLLHAFCVVDPTLCAPSSDPSQFVVTLQPYLKTQVDNKVGAKLLESIIFIIDAVLPMLSKIPHNVAEELEQDLTQMIAKHSFLTVVHACIKCLCSLSKVAGRGAVVVERLIQAFFKYLDSQGDDNKERVSRSLFCFGLLVRYGNSLLSTANSRRIDISSSLKLFKRYLLTDDFALKIRSLQALGYVLIARPDFMLEEDIKKILEATLSSSSEDRIKMQALQNMYEYLLDAESQLGTDQASNNVVHYVDGGQTVPVAAGAGDTNICGGIVQLYWDTILGRCLDPREQIRESALKIVEVALRQGLVHPITCVPYLIALESDPLEGNSKLAHHLLMSMHEKYPSFFESRLGDGLQMSFTFMQSIIGSSAANQDPKVQQRHYGNVKGKSDGTLAQAKFGVARIYKLIRGNRASRNKFMSSIVRKFDNPSWNDTVIPFLMYCTEVLALLPFTLPDEPLYLVYTINRIVQVRAGVLEANLKNSLHSGDSQQIPQVNIAVDQPLFSHSNAMDLNETFQPVLPAQSIYITGMDLNGTFPQETINNFGMCPPTTSEAKLHASDNEQSGELSQDVLQKIQADCLAATALQLLLKLKRHLKIVYGLNDARCQAFSPNEPQKPGEFLTRQNIPFDISDTKCSLPTSRPECVQRYQELKNALREDTVDYAIYTANIKRKRPTPRKGARPGRAIAGDGEDEDDDEWTGGYQRSNSGRKGGRGRQRF